MKQKAYLDGPHGQIHVHQWGKHGPCIVCLAPAPYSGVAYDTFAPHLAHTHRVVAMDYPGYGQSAPTPATPTIEHFAQAALAAADALSPHHPVTLLGFHTGTLVAIEAACQQPLRIRNTVLIDVPFFERNKRAELLIKMGAPRQLDTHLTQLEADWQFSVEKRLEHVPLRRGFDLFVDQISTGEGINAAFHAAFSYACEERLATLARPTLVVATHAGLHAPSLAAARLIDNATLIERPDIEVAVLEKGAKPLSETVLSWLSA